MIYELMGRGHAAALLLRAGRGHATALRRRTGRELGQGTVEYVGLILLIGVVLAGVVKASGGFTDNSIAKAVIGKLKDAIDSVGGGPPGPAKDA
jgi:H+/gluconate symporter-like permease